MSDNAFALSAVVRSEICPAISVCIPTYNRCARLQQTIGLLLNSKFADFEIVISDDASTDGTWDMLRQITDPRVHCYRNDQNLGGWPNWNFVVRKATAPLIFRMDDDDYVDDEFLGRMVALFHAHPGMMSAYSAFAYTRSYDFTKEIEIIDSGVFSKRSVVHGAELIRAYLLHAPFPGIHPSSVVYRREAGEQVGFYRPGLNDHSFTLALAACGDVGYIAAVHFYYVQHDESRVSNSYNQGCLDRLRDYDPLAAARAVYDSPFEPLRSLPQLQAIKDAVYRKHLRLYPCVQFYTVRNNYHRRTLVTRAFHSMAQKYPEILLDPVVWAGFFAMLLPMPIIRYLMRHYRKGNLSLG